jgi:glycosyltransferase involved in cell wall biosynthesis
MHIAILGTRGIPANYSGLEACVEETAARLVNRGHAVTVYCRAHGNQPPLTCYKGVKLVWLPVIETKHGETILHTLLSSLHAVRHFSKQTVIHLYGVGNAPFLAWFRMLGYPSIISVDGQDWRRAKWGRVASTYLRWSARIAAQLSHYCIVDSKVVEDFYRTTFQTPNIRYVPYGYTHEEHTESRMVLHKLGLTHGEYLLFVGRVVPEKGVHYLLQAFRQISTNKKLVIVGAMQDQAYGNKLRRLASPNTVFAGPVYGAEAAELYKHAYLYVHPSDVDGTSHALLSAMGSGLAPLTSDIPENLETVGGIGFSFRKGDVTNLARRLQLLLNQPELLALVGKAAQRRIQQHYNWDAVTDALQTLYEHAATTGKGSYFTSLEDV